MSSNIRHDRDSGRFSLQVNGDEAFLVYREVGERTLDYVSTYVPPQCRGREVGKQLVVAALEYAKDRGFQVIPTCWYVARVMDSNPKYRSLMAGSATARRAGNSRR